jgi:asparagine synthase (glutamine-hydrolysing)
VRRVVPRGLRRPLFGLCGALYPKLDWAPRPLRAKAILGELACDTIEAYFSSVSICGDELRRRIFSDHLLRELQGYTAVDVLRSHMGRCDSEDPLSQVQYADFKTYLPGDILTKVDRASMANSLEVRVPLLDHTLVEWAAQIPSHLKLHGREGKHIFKTALEPYVPRQMLYRPKQGFAVPLAAWFRGPLRRHLRERLCGPVLHESGLFDIGTIGMLIDQHQSGARDHSAALWMLSMMESFLRQVDGVGIDTETTPENADSIA